MSRVVERVYPGEVPRPSVEVQYFSEHNILVAGTPWGTKDALHELANLTKEYFSTSLADGEATSPFARLPGLSDSGNTLRIATMLANETVFQKLNRDSYNSACEALVMSVNRGELSWIQVGMPHLLLVRGDEIQPLSAGHDLSLDFGVDTPLPARLIGVEKNIELETKSLKMKAGDRLLMVARSSLPKSIFAVSPSGLDSPRLIEALFTAMAKSEPKKPFWIGLFEA